jgi:integrase
LLVEAARIDLPLSKPEGTDTYSYTVAEVTAMVEHCLATPALTWLGHVLVGLAHLGVRIAELAGLRWHDVDFKSQTIRIADERSSRRKVEAGTARTTKGRRSRTIPIHSRLRQLLQTLERKEDGLVFHAARGGALRPNNVLYLFQRDVIDRLKDRFPAPKGDIGFEHGTLHSFRHYFCSQCFLGGASEGEIREWLGHRDSKMVEHYRHLRGDDARRKMDRITFLDKDGDEPSSTEVA